ncbi:hypothetical protein JCM5296_004385 [Sporobolomyces johnsonii]
MASWDLSPLYRHSSSVLLPSSDAIVSTHNDRIVLRDAHSLQIIRTWSLHLGPPHPSRPPAPTTPTPPQPEPSLFTAFSVSPTHPHYILAYGAKVSTAWAIHPDHDDPIAKLQVGPEGAVAMAWSATGDVVMAWSAHHLRLSLFRLSDPSVALHIQSPKHSHPDGYAFRPTDGRYLAVLERHASRDCIGVYDTASWSLIRHITLPDPTSDLASLSWSPCGRYIATWSSVTDYYLHIYTPDGRHLSTFSPYASLSPPASLPASSKPASRARPSQSAPAASPGAPAAQSDKNRSREERSTAAWVGLGIRSVEWHPSGEWLAIGGWDGRIRILTKHGWSAIAELTCPTKITSHASVWREPADWIEKTLGKGIVSFIPLPLPFSPTPVQPDLARPNPKMGIARMTWSRDGRWLAVWNQSHPTSIWIHAFLSPSSSSSPPSSSSFSADRVLGARDDRSAAPVRLDLHLRPRLHTLLVLSSPVKHFEWQPAPPPAVGARGEETLAVVSGTKGFVLWRAPGPHAHGAGEGERGGKGEEKDEETREGIAEGVGVPSRAAFAPTSLAFTPRGDALLLSERGGTFCVAYPVYPNDGGAAGGGGGEGEQQRAMHDEAGERTWIEEEDQ